MQDKYKIQPREGHPVPDLHRQFIGNYRVKSGIMDVYKLLAIAEDCGRFKSIVAGFNALNPFSILGKK